MPTFCTQFATHSPISLKGPIAPELSLSNVCEIIVTGLHVDQLSFAGPAPYLIFLSPSVINDAKLSLSTSPGVMCESK
jgi:hypothetical protein